MTRTDVVKLLIRHAMTMKLSKMDMETICDWILKIDKL